MIRPHRDLMIGAPFGPALRLFLQDRVDQRHHVGVACEMLVFIERAADLGGLTLDVSEMQKVYAIGQAFHHAGKIIVRPVRRASRNRA